MARLTAREVALLDIKEDNPINITYNNIGYAEVWNITISRLDTKNNRRLNKLAIK